MTRLSISRSTCLCISSHRGDRPRESSGGRTIPSLLIVAPIHQFERAMSQVLLTLTHKLFDEL